MDKWHNCYDDSWKDIIVPEAFVHPAKMARGLTVKIFKHASSESWIKPGDVVVDPFGGIGSTGIIGGCFGLQVVCVELEEQFRRLAGSYDCPGITKQEWVRWFNRFGRNKDICPNCQVVAQNWYDNDYIIPNREPHHYVGNFEKNRLTFETFRHFGKPQHPVIIQGDSRKLSEVLSCINWPEVLGYRNEETKTQHRQDNIDRNVCESTPIPTSDCPQTQQGGANSTPTNGVLQNKNTRHKREKQCDIQARKGLRPEGMSQESQEQMREMRGSEQSVCSSSEQRSLRQPPGEFDNALQFLPHEHNEEEVVGGKEGRIANTKKQRADRLGQASIIISSPPYASALGNRGHEGDQEKYIARQQKYNDAHPEYKRPSAESMAYPNSPGQLGAMKPGSVEAIISSPPYAESLEHKGGIDPKKSSHSFGPYSQMNRSDTRYGKSSGNLGNLKPGDPVPKGVDAIVSSPPFEESLPSGDTSSSFKAKYPDSQTGGDWGQSYGSSAGNIGNDKGETFWQAARQIVSECHKILKPGGHAIWVVKSFVRKGKIVDFPGDWRRLCEAQGFKTVHEHHAMLVKETRHDGLFEEIVETKERKSFFRRLAEKKGSPKIDYEVVLCTKK